MVGAVVALGVFTRFTFIIFAAPAGALMLADGVEATSSGSPRVRTALVAATAGALVGCTSLAAAAVAVDSAFFGGPGGGLRFAPWHSLLYNIDTSNLAQHGLHPHWQHLVVNGLVMFGPLWPLALTAVMRAASAFAYASCRSKNAVATHTVSVRRAAGGAPAPWHLLLLSGCTLVVAIAALSAAPHQEPRFLAPLVWPLAFVGAYALSPAAASAPKLGLAARAADAGAVARSGRWCSLLRMVFWPLWLVFNAAAIVFFGGLHQAHVPGTAAALGGALRAVYAGVEPPSTRYPHLMRAATAALTATAPNASDIDLAYVGVYMVPHAAFGLAASGAPASWALAAGAWQLPTAPWIAAGANGAHALRSRGGLLTAATASAPERRLRLQEYGSPLELGAALTDALKAAAAAAEVGAGISAPTRLVVFPSTLRAEVVSELATLPPRLGRVSLLEFGVVGPFLSTENPPRSADGWLALLVPAGAARAAIVRMLGGDASALPEATPSLIFALLKSSD